jgi:hypothetical protein
MIINFINENKLKKWGIGNIPKEKRIAENNDQPALRSKGNEF